jgi:hypothetical protein
VARCDRGTSPRQPECLPNALRQLPPPANSPHWLWAATCQTQASPTCSVAVGNRQQRAARCRHSASVLREERDSRTQAPRNLDPTSNEPRYREVGPLRRMCVIGFWKLFPRNAGGQRLFEPVLALTPAALICLGGILIGMGGIAFYAWNLGESTVQSLVDHVHRCAKLMDDTARLSCYDSLGSLQPAKGANAPPLGTK